MSAEILISNEEYKSLGGEHNDPKEEDPVADYTFAKILIGLFLIFVLLLVALSQSWFFIRVVSTTTVVPTPVAQLFEVEFSLTQLRYQTSASVVLRDYEQTVIPSTKTVFSGIYASMIIALVTCSTLFAVLASAYMCPACSDDQEAPGFWKIFTTIFFTHNLATLMVGVIVLMCIAATLVPLALPNAFNNDDVVNQVSGGLMSCNGGSVVNCGSFWVSNINTVQTNIYKDTHRPDTAWWIMIVTALMSMALFKMLWYGGLSAPVATCTKPGKAALTKKHHGDVHRGASDDLEAQKNITTASNQAK